MSFENKIKDFTKNLPKIIEDVKNEDETIIYLINPFLKLLGYNTQNPKEIKYQYELDIKLGVNKAKKKGKIDIVILNNNNDPEIIIECKKSNLNLKKEHKEQLKSYYNITPNYRVGILTNGVIYKFFTNTNKLMDNEPFIEIDLRNLSKIDISNLEMFTKEKYNLKNLEDIVLNNKIRNILNKEFEQPSDEFVKLISKQIDKGIMNKNKIKKFRRIIKNNLKIILNEESEPLYEPEIKFKFKKFSEEEENKFIELYNKLPKKFKDEEFIENTTIIKLAEGEKIPKNSLYIYNSASNPVDEILIKYLRKYTKKFEKDFIRIGSIKSKDKMRTYKTSRRFVAYLNNRNTLTDNEKNLLDKIFSEEE